MTETLKPCPKCQSTNTDHGHLPVNSGFQAWCDDCGLQTGHYEFDEEAVNDWNTRPPDRVKQQLAEALKAISGYREELYADPNDPPDGESLRYFCNKKWGLWKTALDALAAFDQEQQP